jgi:SPP1 gp7 family putative phage head morphogenesis protein
MSSYWKNRQAQLNRALEKDEATLKKRLVRIYRTEERRLEREIASYYANYGVNNVIEYRTLLQGLSEADFRLLMERMDDFAAKYPEYAHLMPVRESIYRLNRLEGLERSIQMQQLEMGVKEQQEVQKHLERQVERGFKAMEHDLGIKNTYGVFDKTYETIMHDVVNTRWVDGKNFSDRIWNNRQKLADTLKNSVASGFARGDNYQKMVTELRQQFNVDRNKAFRLIYTEGTFVMNESKARAVQDTFEYYSLSTVGDSKVCEVCESIQDESEAEPIRFDARIAGDNFPPLHPWCRCTYTIVVPDPSKWIDAYVEKHGGDPEVDEETRKAALEVLNRFT